MRRRDSRMFLDAAALVLFGAPADIGPKESWAASTWQLVIAPDGDGSRLLSRGRSDYTPGFLNRLFFGRFPIEAITFVMTRKMLLEIKRLAERDDTDPTDVG